MTHRSRSRRKTILFILMGVLLGWAASQAGFAQTVSLPPDLSREQKLTNPLPRPSSSSEIEEIHISSLNSRSHEERLEGPPLHATLASPCSRPTRFGSQEMLQKLACLSQAMIQEKIPGTSSALGTFTRNYLVAIGVELDRWLEESSGESYFEDLFGVNDPWVLVFLAMSPASMHEYTQDLDLPRGATDILAAQRLPVTMNITPEGNDFIIEVRGMHEIWLTFRVNERNEVLFEELNRDE